MGYSFLAIISLMKLMKKQGQHESGTRPNYMSKVLIQKHIRLTISRIRIHISYHNGKDNKKNAHGQLFSLVFSVRATLGFQGLRTAMSRSPTLRKWRLRWRVV